MEEKIKGIQPQIYPQDYEIRIKHDIHGDPHWQLFKKGEPIGAGLFELELVLESTRKIARMIDDSIIMQHQHICEKHYGSREEYEKKVMEKVRENIERIPFYKTHIHKND